MPIINKRIRLIDAAKVFPGGKRTLERWVKAYRDDGEAGLAPKSTRPRSQPNETPVRIKERIIELRKKKRLCAKKLNYKLTKEGIVIADRTIGKIIKAEGLNRKYRVRKLKYKYIKVPLQQGDLVEIDVKYVPDSIEGKEYYQFTAIDSATRWRYLAIYRITNSLNGSGGIVKETRNLNGVPTKVRSFTLFFRGFQKEIELSLFLWH